MIRQLKARFDEENKAIQQCNPKDWEERGARLKTLGYLGQVLISSMRAYEEWSHDYEADPVREESDAANDAAKEEFKERLQTIRELATTLPEEPAREEAGADAEETSR